MEVDVRDCKPRLLLKNKVITVIKELRTLISGTETKVNKTEGEVATCVWKGWKIRSEFAQQSFENINKTLEKLDKKIQEIKEKKGQIEMLINRVGGERVEGVVSCASEGKLERGIKK